MVRYISTKHRKLPTGISSLSIEVTNRNLLPEDTNVCNSCSSCPLYTLGLGSIPQELIEVLPIEETVGKQVLKRTDSPRLTLEQTIDDRELTCTLKGEICGSESTIEAYRACILNYQCPLQVAKSEQNK